MNKVYWNQGITTTVGFTITDLSGVLLPLGGYTLTPAWNLSLKAYDEQNDVLIFEDVYVYGVQDG